MISILYVLYNNTRCQTWLLPCYNNGLHHHHSLSMHGLCLHVNILFFSVICEEDIAIQAEELLFHYVHVIHGKF